jgi:hypothetical protein
MIKLMSKKSNVKCLGMKRVHLLQCLLYNFNRMVHNISLQVFI